MTPREAVLAQIAHQETRPVPYTFGCEDPELTERLVAHYGAERWRSLFTPYIVHVGGIDAALHQPNTVPFARDGFGSLWRMDRRPWHLQEPALKEPSFEGYDFPTADRFVNPGLRDGAAKAMAAHPDSFSIIGLGWGLFELTWRIRGFENALIDAATEPDFYAELLDRLTDLRLSMVAQCADVPADAIFFGDDWGDQRGVILGPDRWRRFLKPRWAKVIDAVHAQGKIAMCHSCGSIVDILPDVIEIGLDVFESVQPEAEGMNPYELKRQYGKHITFWGCLGSQSTIQFGTPQEIHDEVRRLVREVGAGGGFILAAAKALQPGTSFENAVAVVEAFTNQGA
ncbi:hypothetical protein FJZ36_02920 [Candidatus Poribacteria bacterium]|nr:hypothetical protein [Candidatus Poribacteria bacterium]